MLTPLAPGPRWREVRAIAAGARQAGVAWGLRAWDLDLPPDAAAMSSWMDGLTNATGERGSSMVTWH
jgi:hypothetical protein